MPKITNDMLFKSADSAGEFGSDMYGTVDAETHASAFKELHNLSYYPNAGYILRRGNIFIETYTYEPFILDWYKRGVILDKTNIKIIDYKYPFEVNTISLPANLVYDDIINIFEVVDSENKSVYCVVTQTGSYYLNLLYDPVTKQYTSTLEQLQFQDGALATADFKPEDLIFAQNRAIAAFKGVVYFSSLSSITDFTIPASPTLATPFKFYLFDPTSKEIVSDLLATQNALYIVSENYYFRVNFLLDATAPEEAFELWKIRKKPSLFNRFLTGNGNVYCVGSYFIDVLAFDNFNKLVHYTPLTAHCSHVWGTEQAKIVVGWQFDDINFVIYILRDSVIYRLVTSPIKDNYKLIVTSYYSYPYDELRDKSVYIYLSENFKLVTTQFKGKYYVCFRSAYKNRYEFTKNNRYNTQIESQDFRIITENIPYLDYARIVSTLVQDPIVYDPRQPSLVIPKDKIKGTPAIGKNLSFKRVSQDNNVHWFKTEILAVQDLTDSYRFIIKTDTIPNNLVSQDPITKEQVSQKIYFNGLLDKNIPANLDYLSEFYDTRFVYAIYYVNGAFEVRQILSANDLQNIPENLYCCVGVGYRAYMNLLTKFIVGKNFKPSNVEICTTNATANSIFLYTHANHLNIKNKHTYLSLIKNYNDNELRANFRDLLDHYSGFVPATTVTKFPYFKYAGDTNDSYTNIYICWAIGRCVRVHYVLLY